MQTNLAKRFQQDPAAEAIESILRKCVHCGFCNATCPTYQLRGDELDGPRGRIYQMKQFFEGTAATPELQLHLDRCLTCRSCETTCPSGVKYSHLLEIGREKVELDLPRSAFQNVLRWGITWFLSSGWLFKTAIACGKLVSPVLPASLKSNIPQKQAEIEKPVAQHKRRILMLAGCVQPTLTPNTNAMAIKLLDQMGISTIEIEPSHCCGALGIHTSQYEQGRTQARKLIDYWWPYIEDGVEAIVTTASGCGIAVKDYPKLFAHESAYKERAKTVSKLACDISELVAQEIKQNPLKVKTEKRVAFHTPCTLQHGLGLKGKVDDILKGVGYEVCQVADAHLCCGSAGTYSIFQPEMSKQLRSNKQAALTVDAPDIIATANIGCQLHIANGAEVPVVHWVELVYEALAQK